MAQEIVIVGDDGTEHVFPSGFDPARAAAIVRSRNVTPISADEPSTYAAGALKGAKEGIIGGAKGFAEGMLQSPASFAKGIVSMLTTNPVTTVKDAIAAIERLPDAVRSAGVDPEAWGQGVGDVTGQTMIGMAGPRAVKAGVQAAPAAMRTVGAAAAIPAGAAIGGTVGGPVGAAVGAGLGGLAREAIQAIPPSAAETAATAASAAAQRLTAALSSGEAIPAAKFFELLRQVPPNERAAVLAARQAAVEGATAPAAAAPAPATAPPAAAPAPPPTAAPLAQPEPSSPSAAPVAAAAPASNIGAAYQAVLKAFEDAGATPQRAEAANAVNLLKWGKSPAEAVSTVMGNRPGGAAAPPAVDPAAELARRLGTPSDAQVAADMAKRAVKGQKTLMRKYAADVPPVPTEPPPAVPPAASSPLETVGYEDVPKSSRRTVELSPTEQYALHWVKQDMESLPFTKHTFNETLHRGSDFDIVPGSGGAPIYQEIIGDVSGASRGDVLNAIRNLQQGKVTKLGELVLSKVKEVADMSEAQLKKRFVTSPPHFSEVGK
jgi:hypothetical protein